MLTKPQAFYDNIHKQALGYQNPFYLRKAQQIKPTLYDGIIISAKHVSMPMIDDEETLILEEESRSKMSKKEKDPEAIKQNISHKPIDYEKLNRLSDDFGKRLTPQQELSAEQAFWLRMSNPTSKPSNTSPVKIEAPKELPKVSLVNESLKKLKFHLARFDNMVKIRTTPDARIEDLLNEIMEVQTNFDQMDAAVQQSLIDKKCLEIAKKELILENDRLLQQIMSQDVLLTVMNSMSLFGESMNMDIKSKESCDKFFNLEAELLKSQNLHNDLLKIKGKEIADIAAQIPFANTIVPGMFKLHLEPLAPRLLQNREAHIDYLKYTQEQADIIHGIVEQAKAEQPLDKELDFSCKHAQLIQELLVYVRDTCPNAIKLNEKKVAVTPKKRSRKLALMNLSHPQATLNRSKPTGNKKNDRISQTSRNMKNKVEAQPRKVNKKNRVGEPIRNVDVKHSLLNANYKPICATYKKSMFDGVHDMLSRLYSVRFENDHITRIMGYGNYRLGNVTISRVYYVEGLGHNLFSFSQFCDMDLEVAFWKNTCFIRNLEGVNLIFGSRDTNLYTISLDDMLKTSLNFILSKASKPKSWLWHHRLSHLNFVCALGKSKKSSHQPKAEDTNQEKLYLLHMDLCGPMRVASIVIVDNYSRFTWVKFFRIKVDAPEVIIKCIKNIQVRLNAIVRNVRIDNGTEFVNQTLREFYENVGISHQTSVARTPQQNGVVESSGPGLHSMTPATSSSGLIPNIDAPSTSIPSTQEQEHSLTISQGFEESSKTLIFHNDRLHESLHEDSTSQGSSSNVRQTHTPFEHLGRWTKDHPITNIIINPSPSVSTRKQLQTDAMWCYLDAFPTLVEPKNFKQAMTEPSSIDAMQEEIHEFQR
ncbi:retrovirus-related pol polyprotein from transposon TNT 1-94 [Tanacetum coccineum]